MHDIVDVYVMCMYAKENSHKERRTLFNEIFCQYIMHNVYGSAEYTLILKKMFFSCSIT